jgi:uncharacterized protein YkwD
MGTDAGRPRRSTVRALFVAALGAAVGCSAASDPGGESSPVGCEPGTVSECFCPNGLSGTQTCADDRTFDACVGCVAGDPSQPQDNVVDPLPSSVPSETEQPAPEDPVIDPVDPVEEPPPAPTTEPVEPPPPPPPPPESDVPSTQYCAPVAAWDPLWAQWEAEVLLLVNERRALGADCGEEGYFGPASPLTMNEALRCAARLHSMDMGVRNYFDHDNPDGLDPFQRIAAAGYVGNLMAENIAAAVESPASVVGGWMTSPGHCSNIMHPDLLDIGVGYYMDPTERGFEDEPRHYWTQNFGAPW